MWLVVGAAASAFLAVPATAPAAAPRQANDWSRDDATHLLRRAGFGGTPQQIDRLHALGKSAAVEHLLTGELPAGAEGVFEPAALTDFALTPPDPNADRKAVQRGQRQDLGRLRVWWVDRMLRTDRPLDEKMSLFWHGLFTSGAREVKSATLMANQNALFHQHATGNYKALAHAITRDGAMLRYLDAAQNVKGKPNENLARELMELFTMGEGNGYTEKDIAEVARSLTGVAVRGRDGQYLFRERAHDAGEKTILGKRGNFGPDEVVEIIFDRPEPSRYLARRLWEFFAHPNPSDSDLQPVVKALKQSDYELKPALRALFTSPAFYGEKAKFALIKSPVDLVVGTMRTMEQAPAALPAAQAVVQMGQELLQPPNVRGWPGGEQWITAATLYTRYNAATAIAEGSFGPGRGNPNRPNKPQAAAKAELRGAAGADAVAADADNGRRAKRLARKQLTPEQRQAVAKEMRQRRRQQAAAGGGDSTPATPAPKPPPARPGNNPAVALIQEFPVRAEPASPRKLFPDLPGRPSAAQVVDAAIARFHQRPLEEKKRAALIEALGDEPLTLGERQSDQRVRAVIGLLLSTPEYQVH